MTSRGNTLRGAVFALGTALVLTGCGSSTGGNTNPSTSPTSAGTSQAADAPSAYDPCKDVPQTVLDAEKLRRTRIVNDDTSAGVKWRGCAYIRSNGYGVSITTTNLTVDATRGRNFPETAEFTVNGRRAISTRQFDGPYIKEACTVNVEMKGGSLDFNLSNPPSNRDTGSTDSCVLARGLAEKVVPSLPASA